MAVKICLKSGRCVTCTGSARRVNKLMAEYLKTGKNKKFCCDKVDGGEFCTLLSRIESWEEVESRQPDGHGGDGGDGKLSDLLDGAKRISVEF